MHDCCIQILELPSYSIIGSHLLCSFSGSGEWLITTLSKTVKGQKISGGIEHIHRHIYKNKMNRGHIWSISMLMFLLAVYSRIFVTFFHIFPQAVWRNSQAATASPLVEVQLSPLHWCEYWPRLIFLWTQLKCFVNVQTPPIRDAVRRSTVYWQTFQLAKIRRKLTHVSLLVRLHWLHRFISWLIWLINILDTLIHFHPNCFSYSANHSILSRKSIFQRERIVRTKI